MTQNSQQGFSLIEVLAAITLMAVTALLISQALGIGVAASDRLTLRAGTLTERVVARRTLARLVAGALPPKRAAFEGDARRLRFTRRAGGDADPGSLVLGEITADGEVLVLTECAAIAEAGRQPEKLSCANPRQERLRLDFGAPVSLIYRSGDGARAGRWRNRKQLPALIEVDGAALPFVIPFRLGDRP